MKHGEVRRVVGRGSGSVGLEGVGGKVGQGRGGHGAARLAGVGAVEGGAGNDGRDGAVACWAGAVEEAGGGRGER